MTTTDDLLADVVAFLNNTLATEDLSSSANQQRLLLLQKILSRDSTMFSYVDMNGSHKSIDDIESPSECYEELESSWSGSGASSGASRNYSNTLPSTSKHQRFSFFFPNGLCESKNTRELSKTSVDITDHSNDCSKRNSILSDSDNSLSPSSVKSEDSLEIMSISASAIKYSAIKSGLLLRKEKVLFVEHSKRLWVALLGTTLFVYNSEKDAKPIYSINVDEYTARPIAVSYTNKKEFGFEIICPGKKTYQFYSYSKTEMETWILSINHSVPLPQTSSVISSLSSGSALPSTPNTDSVDAKLAECSEKRNYRDSYKFENGDNPAERELPSLPLYLHYDTPNPICRAVVSDLKSERLDNLIQETFYHSIEESLAEQLARYDYPTRKDPVFRNKENVNKNYNPGDNVYYNILNRIKQQDKTENISTLSDTTISSSLKDVEEKENICHKNGISKIRQLIQKMEDINNQNTTVNKKGKSLNCNSPKLNSITSISSTSTNEDIYELVNSQTYVNINA